jgi:hypothetical protein
LKPIQIITSPQSHPPFQVDAWVYEQDTALLLDAASEIKSPSETTAQLIEQAVEQSPLIPGSVLVRGYCPLELLAIVHDFDQEPSWQEEWILKALHRIMQLSEQHCCEGIGMPMLGTLHGSLNSQRFLELLLSVREQNALVYLKRLWLVS